MAEYCVNANAQPTGEHEVHNLETCTPNNLPDPSNRHALGSFSNCRDAVRAAGRVYNNVDGCYHCSRDCHTR